jgi:hypothetical protein
LLRLEPDCEVGLFFGSENTFGHDQQPVPTWYVRIHRCEAGASFDARFVAADVKDARDTIDRVADRL